jgi:hypothetical protein
MDAFLLDAIPVIGALVGLALVLVSRADSDRLMRRLLALMGSALVALSLAAAFGLHQ